MTRKTLLAFGFISVLALGGSARADMVMDRINDTKTPETRKYQTARDVGWFYHPSLTYTLTGINTEFGPTVDNRTVTVEFFLAGPPSNGGSLLGSGTFTPLANAFAGGTFAPIEVTAGTKYFVGFRNVSGLSLNTTTDIGAVVASDLRFDTDGLGGYTLISAPGDADRPILQFVGRAVPEPSGVLMISSGVLGLIAYSRRRRTAV